MGNEYSAIPSFQNPTFSRSRILLTSPHSLCVPLNITPKRTCDKLASQALDYLYSHLKDKIDTDYEKADLYRYQVDLNRKEGRNTEFRQLLRYKMRKNKYSLLLDIHSYPYPSLSKDEHSFFDKDERITDMVILVSPYSDNHLESMLYTDLKSKISIKIIKGSEDNDIMKEANEYNIPSILLEFYENLDNNQLDYITKLISDFLIEYLVE